MAAGTFTLYSKNKKQFRLEDIIAATVKVMLVTSSYTPDSSVTGNYLLADVTNEITNANGYSTGGATVTTDVNTAITGGFKYTSDAVVWTASGGSIDAWRTAIMYISGSLWGLTSPLIGYFLGDATPANIAATTTGNTLTLTPPSGGWFDLT